MNGRLEVERLTKRLDLAFDRVDQIDDLEAKAYLAAYLCVRVAGLAERACAVLALEYCRTRAAPSVVAHVQRGLQSFRNPNTDRLLQFVASFDETWATSTASFVDGARSAALDSVMARRHQIAHGDDAGISYVLILDYYVLVQEILDFLVALFDPAPTAPAVR